MKTNIMWLFRNIDWNWNCLQVAYSFLGKKTFGVKNGPWAFPVSGKEFAIFYKRTVMDIHLKSDNFRKA